MASGLWTVGSDLMWCCETHSQESSWLLIHTEMNNFRNHGNTWPVRQRLKTNENHFSPFDRNGLFNIHFLIVNIILKAATNNNNFRLKRFTLDSVLNSSYNVHSLSLIISLILKLETENVTHDDHLVTQAVPEKTVFRVQFLSVVWTLKSWRHPNEI